MSTMGSPPNLRIAIEMALCCGPLNAAVDRTVDAVIVLLAQKFGIAAMKASDPKVEEAILELFNQIKQEAQK